MGYIYVEKDGVQAQYLITSTAVQPRLVVGELGYVPLVMGTTNAPMLKYAPADGYETLRAGSYTSTTVKSTSSSVGSSSVGCAGTSSSSGSTLDSTIQASTAISFTSTSAFTRVSTSGYNGLSNAQAQTCESTSSWAGMSTRQSNYQTEVANSYGLTNATALTQSSTSGWDYPQAYQITRTWYHTLNRTTGYSGYSVGWGYLGNVQAKFTFSAYCLFQTNDNFRYTYYRADNGRFTCLSFDNAVGWVDIVSAKNYMTDATRNVGQGYFGNDGYGGFYDYDAIEDIAGGEYYRSNDRKDARFDSIIAYDDNRKTVYYNPVTYQNYYRGGFCLMSCYGNEESGQLYTTNYVAWGDIYGKQTNYFTAANTAGMQGVTELTENYLDYNNPQYDYGWVVTNTVARTCSSTYGYRGITSRASSYTTTLANSAGLSNVTALTRSSTSAYSGISCSRSDYYGTQVNSNGMTNATAMTRESIYGYSGVTSRSSPYNTTSNAVENLSHTTALVEPVYRTNTVTTAFSGVKFEYSYPVHSFVFGYYSANSGNGMMYSVYGVDSNASYTIYDTVGDVIARNRSYASVWMPAYVDYQNVGEYIDIYFPDATYTKRNILNSYDIYSATGTGGPGGGGNTYTFRKTFTIASKTVTYTSTNMDGMRSATSLTGTVLGVIDHYNTTGYTGISSRQSNYNVTKENSAGLSNVTTLTRSSTSGYTGVLSRTSSYETLIPNDGQNALVAQALTCSSTSEWGGKSSTSESISSTELRTSYFTSGYTESTTISMTDRVLTTTIYSDTVTVQSSSLSSGNGYKIVGGAIVVDQGGYDYYTVESFSTYGQSTFVVVAESMETTTLRTGTYTRTSQAIMSYGARTSLSTYINTNTYIETIWGYM